MFISRKEENNEQTTLRTPCGVGQRTMEVDTHKREGEQGCGGCGAVIGDEMDLDAGSCSRLVGNVPWVRNGLGASKKRAG